jgi:hypothetical protein
MPNTVPVRSVPPAIKTRQKSRRLQAYVLLILGIIALILAQFLHLRPFEYPIGILAFGFGLVIAFFFNPRHLAVASWMIFFMGIEIFLLFKTHIIPANQTLSTFVLAIAAGLLVVTILGKLGFVGKGAISPFIFVLIFGLLEYALAAGQLTVTYTSIGITSLNADPSLPKDALNFLLSLWLPGIGLILFGLYYLVVV